MKDNEKKILIETVKRCIDELCSYLFDNLYFTDLMRKKSNYTGLILKTNFCIFFRNLRKRLIQLMCS